MSAAIDMTSTREKHVTQSSCESEIVVQSKLALRARRFYLMLTELGVKVPLPMIMYCDNEAAVTLASQEQINMLGRTKYFNRQIWQIHELVADGTVEPTWIGAESMDSDMGTKPLMGSNFDHVSNRSFSRMHECRDGLDSLSEDISETDPSIKIGGGRLKPKGKDSN